jgi:hypothetical protein
MSKTTKIVIAVIVIAAIGYGVYKYIKSQKPDAPVIDIAGGAKPSANAA